MDIHILRFESVESTNVTAVQYALDGADEGTVIVADQQQGGRGRMKRVWSSPLGGLWFSIILRPKIDPEHIAQVTMVAGIAVAKVLRKLYENDIISIKWPNDLLVRNKKVCGILSEMQLNTEGNVDYVVVGIGINVNVDYDDFPTELKGTAASLNEIFNKKITCSEVLHKILIEFNDVYEKWISTGLNVVLQSWGKMNCTIGEKVLVKDDDKVIFSGIAKAIDEKGAIIVVNSDGLMRKFDFGEISIRNSETVKEVH
ncbi:MAG: biotin--[acetyl-CoA-carboxylase] ligase [Parabacteroides sp.]|nr:biotin--[acetyl-CoA-carboxylase] ligase [Parabacteroides sp.]